jgi:GDP-L-fucose synthase
MKLGRTHYLGFLKLSVVQPDEGYNLGAQSHLAVSFKAPEYTADVLGFQGNISRDTAKTDGDPRKLMDSSRISDLGWQPKYDLETGLKDAY